MKRTITFEASAAARKRSFGRLRRCLDIVRRLTESKSVYVGTVARVHRVDVRSVQRDIQLLGAAGFKVVPGAVPGWYGLEGAND